MMGQASREEHAEMLKRWRSLAEARHFAAEREDWSQVQLLQHEQAMLARAIIELSAVLITAGELDYRDVLPAAYVGGEASSKRRWADIANGTSENRWQPAIRAAFLVRWPRSGHWLNDRIEDRPQLMS